MLQSKGTGVTRLLSTHDNDGCPKCVCTPSSFTDAVSMPQPNVQWHKASPEGLRLEILEGLGQSEDARCSSKHRERRQQSAEPGAVLEQVSDVVGDAVNDLAACGSIACAGGPCIPAGCNGHQVYGYLHPAMHSDSSAA